MRDARRGVTHHDDVVRTAQVWPGRPAAHGHPGVYTTFVLVYTIGEIGAPTQVGTVDKICLKGELGMSFICIDVCVCLYLCVRK